MVNPALTSTADSVTTTLNTVHLDAVSKISADSSTQKYAKIPPNFTCVSTDPARNSTFREPDAMHKNTNSQIMKLQKQLKVNRLTDLLEDKATRNLLGPGQQDTSKQNPSQNTNNPVVIVKLMKQ